MKRILSLIVAIVLIVPVISFADIDISSLTDQELRYIIDLCTSELQSRAKLDSKGFLLLSHSGVEIYQTKTPSIDYVGYLRVPISIYNDTDDDLYIYLTNAKCNGWDIYSGLCQVSGRGKTKEELVFKVSDADAKSFSDILTLCFTYEIRNNSLFLLYSQDAVKEDIYW